MIIAVDAMGGEYAPHEIVKGALKAAQEYKIGVALVGKKDILHVQAARHKKNLQIEIVDAPDVILDEESPIDAVAKKPNASIPVGIRMVQQGEAQAFVSAGSTGAVFFCAYMILGKIEGIERPAIGSLINISVNNPFLLIDCGANPNCKPRHLLQFAQMGSIYVRGMFAVKSPRVALLNNGEEEKKGNQLTKETYPVLKASGLNFVGNIEGQEFPHGKADVVVTDGFTGNVVLKTLEGLGDSFLKLRAMGQMFSRSSRGETEGEHFDVGVSSFLKRLDFQESGGASLLGLNGNVVIAHGRSQAKAIKNAIGMAKRCVDHEVCELIQKGDYSAPEALAGVNGEK